MAVAENMTLDVRLNLTGLDSIGVLADVAQERAAQDAKWGQQDHFDGAGGEHFAEAAERAKRATDDAAREGACTWQLILNEEVLEAFAESDPAKLRTELIQVAAVATQWVEAIDRREARA